MLNITGVYTSCPSNVTAPAELESVFPRAAVILVCSTNRLDPNDMEKKSTEASNDARDEETSVAGGDALYEPLHGGVPRRDHPSRASADSESRRPRPRSSSSLARIRSNNGHGVGDDSEDTDVPEGEPVEASREKDPFEVAFDGDHDPYCPRSMSLLHKWVIVIIVGLGSLCL